MKSFLVSILLCLAIIAPSQPQDVVSTKGKKSDEIMVKMRQVDLMIQLIPLTLTKTQINELLLAMEKARQKEIDIRKSEDDELAKLDGKLSDAIKNAVEKGAYPPKELQSEVFKLTKALSIRRQVAFGENVEIIQAAVDKVLNAGQKKVMENSLDPKLFGVKTEGMSSKDKTGFFIKQILMDPLTYDLLKQMYKVAS